MILGNVISIHALLAESDVEKVPADVFYQAFLSTLSLRRATNADYSCRNAHPISIHALLAESDRLKPRQTRTDTNFYPRSPCGERRHFGFLWSSRLRFLSTLSLRRATLAHHSRKVIQNNFYPRSPCGERRLFLIGQYLIISISIHALLAESDLLRVLQICPPRDFYPRSPCGERLNEIPNQRQIDQFLSTLSLRRATRANRLAHAPPEISIHALLAESD